jgi:hypothetical protein
MLLENEECDHILNKLYFRTIVDIPYKYHKMSIKEFILHFLNKYETIEDSLIEKIYYLFNDNDLDKTLDQFVKSSNHIVEDVKGAFDIRQAATRFRLDPKSGTFVNRFENPITQYQFVKDYFEAYPHTSEDSMRKLFATLSRQEILSIANDMKIETQQKILDILDEFTR